MTDHAQAAHGRILAHKMARPLTAEELSAIVGGNGEFSDVAADCSTTYDTKATSTTMGQCDCDR